MKNYKQGLIFAAIWGVIVAIGLIVNPEKTGFTDRPLQTLAWLAAPVVIYFLLVWVITFFRK